MASTRLFVQLMSANRSFGFTFKEEVKSFFFVHDLVQGESFHMDLTLGIVLNRDRISTLFSCRDSWKHVKHELVVDLKVWNSNSKFLVKMVSDLLENLGDCSWDDTSVLVILCATAHSESLACSSLTIDHDCSIETLNNTLDNISCAALKNFFLRWVVKNLIELETPLLLLIVDVTASFILWDLYSNILYDWVIGTLHFGSDQCEDSLMQSWK